MLENIILLTLMPLLPHLKCTASNPWNPSPHWSSSTSDGAFHLEGSSIHRHEAPRWCPGSHSGLTSSSGRSRSTPGQVSGTCSRCCEPRKVLIWKLQNQLFTNWMLIDDKKFRFQPQVESDKWVSSRDWGSIYSRSGKIVFCSEIFCLENTQI